MINFHDLFGLIPSAVNTLGGISLLKYYGMEWAISR